MAFKIIQGHWI